MTTALPQPAPSPTPPPRGVQLPRDPGTEIAVVMDRAAGLRLEAAERLVRSLPALLGDDLAGVELLLSPEGTFTALVRAAGDPLPARRRLAFWCARAGARCIALGDLTDRDRSAFRTRLARCDTSATAEPEAVAAEARRFFAAAGWTPDAAGEEPLPQLHLEVGGPEWGDVRWRPGRRELFVPGPLAPPPGDELLLCLRVASGPALRARARVASARGPASAGPGALAGFTLSLLDPSTAFLLVLDQRAEGGEASYEARRAHPRYPVRAPASLVAAGPGATADPDQAAWTRADGSPRFLLENLSMGGAFVRTEERLAEGSAWRVIGTLPTGDALRLDARVVFSTPRGAGLRWEIDEPAEEELAATVARIAARPRRALLVDDDALFRRMLSDALQARGFEVVCAADGAAALEVLSEELLSLDLLVADLEMPRMDGESLLRTIRRAGGERDLVIVVVSGRLEGGQERTLEREGADAVLHKELGPQFIAQATDAVLERRRASRPA